ncbi:MAG: glycoside hydrolase family 127 protein [Elusimicrobia bacterium]|nr:glycoside hydrolase family 127 protein [Elusimicrobiota bacterium]
MKNAIKITSVEKPEISKEKSKHYLFNRSPLLPNPFAKLPLGSIKPKGWLKHQLDLMINGMTGRLSELSDFLKSDNGWFGGNKEGWEEQPYWLRGFYDLAVLTGDKRLFSEAKKWIDAVIASQDEDGYFGAKYHKCIIGKNGQKICDLWPHMVMLDAIRSHYEHTSDSRVIPMMTHFFKFCKNLPDDQFIPANTDGFTWYVSVQILRAGDMLPHIYWLYNHTGEEWLLDLATRFYRQIEPPTDEWLEHHVVHFTQRFRYSGNYYVQSKYPYHLAQTDYWYDQHMGTWGQQPRGIFGADEKIRHGYTDPRQAFETCAMVEFNKSFYILGRITGEAKYADRCEDITLNHFPASQTKDLKALHYLTASNQPQLDKYEKHDYTNKVRMITYSPDNRYRCCQHNVAMGWPWYVQNLWQATSDSGLAAWLYASNEVTAKVGENGTKVIFNVETDYPFDGAVKMVFKSSKPVSFPLYLRIPGWCHKFKVNINNRPLKVTSKPGTYLRVERTWKNGDVVSLKMLMETSLTTWPRTGSITVNHGPLSYSLKIEERWQKCGGTKKWPEWEVLPVTPWNYGLVVDTNNPSADLHIIKKKKIPNQPWTIENSPIEIKANGKIISDWGLKNETVQSLQPGPIKSDKPKEKITLIPLGCARLRISCFPVIGEGPCARDWKK